jgi:site-specific DNA-methyltransferase (adenine-specific)
MVSNVPPSEPMNILDPYYEALRFKLYLADCLDLLASLDENSVDMVFADPPYFLSSGSFTCKSD